MGFKIIESHRDKSSVFYVLGNYCLNGYQFFHKDEAKKFFEQFKVPKKNQKDILNAFSDEPIPNYDPEIFKDIKERMFFVKLGRNKDLDLLINDPDWCVRTQIIKHGIDKYLDILVNDKNWEVRIEIVRYGRIKDLNILINDIDWYVKSQAIYQKKIRLKKTNEDF